MFINMNDYDFLCDLEADLYDGEGWSGRVVRLWELNEKLREQREKVNEKQKYLMRRKRSGKVGAEPENGEKVEQ